MIDGCWKNNPKLPWLDTFTAAAGQEFFSKEQKKKSMPPTPRRQSNSNESNCQKWRAPRTAVCARRARAIAWWCRGKTSGSLMPRVARPRPSALRHSARSGERPLIGWGSVGAGRQRQARRRRRRRRRRRLCNPVIVILSDSQNGNYLQSVYMSSADACTFNRPTVPGEYEVRFFSSYRKYHCLSRVRICVE
jgi:hypothetical protein